MRLNLIKLAVVAVCLFVASRFSPNPSRPAFASVRRSIPISSISADTSRPHR